MLRGNLFDSAIMKTSVISDEFRSRYLSNPKDPDAFEGRAVVFEGPEDYHHRIEDPSLDDRREHDAVHSRRRADRLSGLGGSREHAAAGRADQTAASQSLPCIGDGRQSGTSGSPSILNASPEAAAGGGLALLKTGDRVRIDLRKGTANMLIPKAELERRRAALQEAGGFASAAKARRRGRRFTARPSRRWRMARPSAVRTPTGRRPDERPTRQSLAAFSLREAQQS